MGLSGNALMEEVLIAFNSIAQNVFNSLRLQKEGDVICIRNSSMACVTFNLDEFIWAVRFRLLRSCRGDYTRQRYARSLSVVAVGTVMAGGEVMPAVLRSTLPLPACAGVNSVDGEEVMSAVLQSSYPSSPSSAPG